MTGRFLPTPFQVINGTLHPSAEAGIGATERSFSLGDGIFETIKVKNYFPVWFEEHLARMAGSANFAGIGFSRKEKLEKDCELLIEKNDIRNGFLRVTLSRGESENGAFADIPANDTLVIIGAPREDRSEPLKASFAPWPINELDPASAHKTTSRFSAVTAWREASAKGLDELVFQNSKGKLAESIFSNLFFVKDKTVKTPSLECGLLPGITREKVLEAAGRLGIKTEEGEFSSGDLRDADEIFFTNSLILVGACGEFDGKSFDAGKITGSLQREILTQIPV
jgi:branched-subunit amino acid aminotransferase/4-amino-4-deoxychorismate lyase